MVSMISAIPKSATVVAQHSTAPCEIRVPHTLQGAAIMRFVRPLTFGHTAAQERVIVRQHRLELLRWGQRRAAHPDAL